MNPDDYFAKTTKSGPSEVSSSSSSDTTSNNSGEDQVADGSFKMYGGRYTTDWSIGSLMSIYAAEDHRRALKEDDISFEMPQTRSRADSGNSGSYLRTETAQPVEKPTMKIKMEPKFEFTEEQFTDEAPTISLSGKQKFHAKKDTTASMEYPSEVHKAQFHISSASVKVPKRNRSQPSNVSWRTKKRKR